MGITQFPPKEGAWGSLFSNLSKSILDCSRLLFPIDLGPSMSEMTAYGLRDFWPSKLKQCPSFRYPIIRFFEPTFENRRICW